MKFSKTISQPTEIGEISRRHILKGLGLCAASTATGCSGIAFEAPTGECPQPNPQLELVVDMHCHIMNLEDADRAAFVKRHIANTDELKLPIWDWFAELAVRVAQQPAVWFVDKARSERAKLRQDFAAMMESNNRFCEIAAKRQEGFIFAHDSKQETGFLSNRARNAARLMEAFPKVDLFTPSMVDFNEGDPGEYSSIAEQALLYSSLSVASRGRFLPIVSYHPGRSYLRREDHPTKERDPISPGKYNPEAELNFRMPLLMIEFAVEHLGFVGVKVHPSTGFAPINNAKFGCPNNETQTSDNLPPQEAIHYDRAMDALFGLCRRLNVPILTHASLGVLANRRCIESKNTFSPKQWLKAIDRANRQIKKDYAGRTIPAKNKLRVCLAHFADGFSRDKKSNRLRPTPWLLEAAAATKKSRDIYLDLSELSDWFAKDGQNISHEHEEAFVNFVSDNDHVTRQIMYGTDWHMPGAAKIGGDYLSGMKNLIGKTLDQRAYLATMGGNAVEFFKLKNGQSGRTRIDRFLEDNGVDLTQVSWRIKADREFPT